MGIRDHPKLGGQLTTSSFLKRLALYSIGYLIMPVAAVMSAVLSGRKIGIELWVIIVVVTVSVVIYQSKQVITDWRKEIISEEGD
jgi:hypothetical protein